MIAMEMGAPDPFDDDGIDAPIESSFAEPTPVEPAIGRAGARTGSGAGRAAGLVCPNRCCPNR